MNNQLRLVHHHHQSTRDDRRLDDEHQQHYTLQHHHHRQQKVYTTSSTLSSSTSSVMQHHRLNASASAATGVNNSRRIDPSRAHAVVNARSVTFDKKQQHYLPKANNKTTPIRRSGSYGNLSTTNIADKKICTCGTNTCKCKGDQNTDATLLSQYLRNLQQQIYFLELENSHLRHHKGENIDSTAGNFSEEMDNSTPYRHNDGDYAVTQMMDDNNMPKVVYRVPDVFAKLEKSREANHMTENHLQARLRELKHIDRERNQLSMQLKRTEDIRHHDKSVLSDEIIDLQKRLDDLTPELAKKEAHIAGLENELHRVNGKLRSAQNQLTSIQLKFDEKSSEDKVMSELENERRLEIERLTRTIRQLESDMTENRSKNTAIMDDLMATKRQMRENELRAKKEKSLGEKVLEENNALIKENSQLSAQLARIEITRERRIIESINDDGNSDSRDNNHHRLSDIAQLREIEKTLKAELQRANERIKFEEKKFRQLESQIMERDTADEKAHESRLRIQKELEALQALSRSLSNENRTLRKDKIVLNDRIDELNKLISDKESEQQMLKECFDGIDKQYRRLVKRFEQDATLQTEKSHEYDLLSRRIRELSESLTRTQTSSHISPHRHEYRSADSMASKLATISSSGTSTPSSSLLSPNEEETNKNKVNLEGQIVADDQQMVEKRKVYTTSACHSSSSSHRRQGDIDKC